MGRFAEIITVSEAVMVGSPGWIPSTVT